MTKKNFNWHSIQKLNSQIANYEYYSQLNRYVICLLPSEKNLTRYIPLSFQKCGVLPDFIFMISTIAENKLFYDGCILNVRSMKKREKTEKRTKKTTKITTDNFTEIIHLTNIVFISQKGLNDAILKWQG